MVKGKISKTRARAILKDDGQVWFVNPFIDGVMNYTDYWLNHPPMMERYTLITGLDGDWGGTIWFRNYWDAYAYYLKHRGTFSY